ncbi:biopolymer transporter ExbD [Opitutus sp. ER46]|uniref:ExbD/TolR family protein n=1 Tax=Opitutus sp. ER46 TaxID=2161864 RepID=UPI000D320465|nr:biopolymer transporter ExbD [Opitutus sp. ER46]PTX96477.1 biopolymer transporter ExbD [Opitutus sp. ER46]
MAGSPKAQEGRKKARIEIIPLIDVIFFLLATFVLFTLSLDKIASVPVTLPKASAEVSGKIDETTINIQVSDSGTYYWKVGARGAPELVSASELAPRLENVRNRESAPRVLVRGDNRAKFGPVVQVLDEVRKARIDQVSVETVTSPTGK